MMGRSHMIAGTVSYLAVAPVLSEITGHGLSRQALGCGAVVAAGAALAPDFDTPNSTIARSLGVVSRTAARGVGTVFGGHRNGTHSILFCAAVAAICALALEQTQLAHLPQGHEVTIGALVALLVGLCSMILLLGMFVHLHGLKCFVIALAAVAIAVALKPGTGWIAVAVLIGCVSHLIADLLTPEGIVPFWPVSSRRVHVALVGATGDVREMAIVGVVVAAGVLLGVHEFRAHPAPTQPAAGHHRPFDHRSRQHRPPRMGHR